jgi:hypothetical protein
MNERATKKSGRRPASLGLGPNDIHSVGVRSTIYFVPLVQTLRHVVADSRIQRIPLHYHRCMGE